VPTTDKGSKPHACVPAVLLAAPLGEMEMGWQSLVVVSDVDAPSLSPEPLFARFNDVGEGGQHFCVPGDRDRRLAGLLTTPPNPAALVSPDW
jgi:hypothetical protein